MTTITLPFPVSVNAMYRAVGKGNKLSAKARAWKTQAGWEIASQRPQKLAGPVAIHLEFTPPDNRRRDGDNFLKIVLDALVAAGLIEDDNTKIIRDRREIWHEPDKEKAGVRVRIAKFE